MNDKEQKIKAREFAEFWKNKGYEKGQSAQFWTHLISSVYGISEPEKYLEFEDQVMMDKSTGFIDVYIPSTKVLIEQKSIEKDLRKAIKQSDGSLLTPFQQAKKYIADLPVSKHPKWVITCNFKSFLIYDMENPNGEPEEILLENLEKEYYRLQFLVDAGNENLKKEMEISIQAGEIVGKLYDEILPLYINPKDEKTLKSLNALCVRLVFCLYAEDAGIFGKHNMFHDYIRKHEAEDLRVALIDLFRVLDTKVEERDPYMKKDLAEFPYVNGGLFADENIEIPNLTETVKELILSKASEDFDWSDISPTIFGAVFESTLNPETRRAGGMHYTSIENIHKVIDPLFLDDLSQELKEIKAINVVRTRNNRLKEFQDKLASLTFLDPACGSGNFLTETYISLRKLENEALIIKMNGQITLGDLNFTPIKVSISQFYGIEINDFAVTVAKTALWIAESQMMKQTEEIVHMNLDFLPLKTYANIVEENALRIDWNEIVPKEKVNFIMGNPPFVGARLMNNEQKEDLIKAFASLNVDTKNVGNIDYVSGWYVKSSQFIEKTKIKCAFVSTNSICQGEQVAILWKPLFTLGININFAYRTFKWNSEASEKAAVHCVIVGFSFENKKEKTIYEGDKYLLVDNINGYLMNAENIFVENQNKTICKGVPQARSGNKPIDDGNYLFTKEEYENFIAAEPLSKEYFRKWIGAYEFINRKERYCLWLGDCEPEKLRKMPKCLQRINNVREFRLRSKSEGTRKLADKPTRFHVETFLSNSYLVLPLTSSERRRYVPIGFISPDVLASNLVIVVANANLYHFGVLTSNVFMAWMRAVCGRLKSDYRITKDNVYNNFPWPMPAEEQKKKIEQTAQAILDARALYPNSSLADLYDELTMPRELRKAHQENDKAVMEAYGFDWRKMTEADCVAELMKMYKELLNSTK